MTSHGRKALLKSNLEFWLNDKLLRNGMYETISVDEQNLYAEDLSVLQNQTPNGASAGGIWQSGFKNWVYESGIPSPGVGITAPIVASGVTVNGTFYPESTVGAFSHKIDHRNGRVIFDTPISTSSTVKAEFSYKLVTVEDARRFDRKRQRLLTETEYKDNPYATGVSIYPTVDTKTLPAIWIDVVGRSNTGHELGNKSLIASFNCVFHVWARDAYLVDMIEDILCEEEQSVILGVDYNTAPFALLGAGEKNPNYTQYSDYAQLWTPYFWRRIYIQDVESQYDSPYHEIERARIRFVSTIYPNY